METRTSSLQATPASGGCASAFSFGKKAPVVKIDVKQLSECPECLTTVGTWIYEQWWSRRYETSEVVFSWLRMHTQKDMVPFTVVAFRNGIPVGSCCVIENDCVHRKQYAPWVAAVYVKPEMRNCGIASMILQEAANIAARINVAGLYIDCLAITAPVYEKNGWKIYEREVGDKDSVVMLRTTSRGPDAKAAEGPNHALQRTRPSRSGCNPRVPRAGSLSLGRSATLRFMKSQSSPELWQPLFC